MLNNKTKTNNNYVELEDVNLSTNQTNESKKEKMENAQKEDQVKKEIDAKETQAQEQAKKEAREERIRKANILNNDLYKCLWLVGSNLLRVGSIFASLVCINILYSNNIKSAMNAYGNYETEKCKDLVFNQDIFTWKESCELRATKLNGTCLEIANNMCNFLGNAEDQKFYEQWGPIIGIGIALFTITASVCQMRNKTQDSTNIQVNESHNEIKKQKILFFTNLALLSISFGMFAFYYTRNDNTIATDLALGTVPTTLLLTLVISFLINGLLKNKSNLKLEDKGTPPQIIVHSGDSMVLSNPRNLKNEGNENQSGEKGKNGQEKEPLLGM